MVSRTLELWYLMLPINMTFSRKQHLIPVSCLSMLLGHGKNSTAFLEKKSGILLVETNFRTTAYTGRNGFGFWIKAHLQCSFRCGGFVLLASTTWDGSCIFPKYFVLGSSLE